MADEPLPPSTTQLSLFAPAEGAGAAPTAHRVAPLPPVAPTTTLDGAAAAFDEHLRRLGKTENTRRSFASDLRLLAAFVGHGRPVASIGRHDLERFVTWLLDGRGEPCSAKSLARRITTLKVCFAWLAAEGAVAADPAVGLVHRRAVAPLPRVLTDHEVDRVLGVAAALRGRPDAPDPRPELVVRLVLETGLKKGELVRLRPIDIQADPASPSLLVRYDAPRFAAKERRIAFGPAVLPVLEAYRRRYGVRDDGPLFDCTPRNLEYVLADLVRQAGLTAPVGFETLRWTAALRSWRAGIAPETLAERLGVSPITWAETAGKLALLAAGVGPAAGVDPHFPEPPARPGR